MEGWGELAALPGTRLAARAQSMLLPARKLLRVARTQLLSECAIDLQVNMAMLHSLWLIPPAHPDQHLGGLEAIGRSGL